jgi:iron complex outermembrane recepter protein
MKKMTLSLSLIAFAFWNAQAQDTIASDTAKTLKEVQITATSNQNKSLLNQPASIAKLNETELKRGTGLFMDDAINENVPGVFMERRTVSAGQQFNIRGYGNGIRGTNGANSNFDGQGSKVYLNGIPITDAEGISLMDDVDFGSIGNVEVTKGPAGTLYGLAIAGAVNLQTQKAEKGKVSIGQDALVGSYGLSRLTSRFQVGGDHSSLSVNYGRQTYDGFIVHTASHKDFVNVMGEFRPTDKQIVHTYMGYSNSYDERQGELTIGQYDTLNYSGNPAYIKNNAHSNVISFRAGLGHTYNFNKHISNTTSVFGCGISSNVSSAGGWTDKDPINYGGRTTIDMKYALNDRINLSGITGGEFQHQYAQTMGYAMIANPNPTATYNIIGAMRSNQVTRSETSSLFTEWTLGMPKDLSLTAGVGISTMLIVLNDRFYVANNPNPVKYAKGYDNMVSPHLALNKVFNKKISAYVSYSKGYKAPVSSYFFIPTTGAVNTDLKPEIGNQFEVGTKGDICKGKLHYEIALFDAVFSDKMTTVAVPLTPPAVGTAYSYIVNRGSLDDKGLELLVKYTVYQSNEGFFKTVKPFANLCYSDFKYVNYTFQTLAPGGKSMVEVDYSGNSVAGVPPFTANAGIDLNSKIGIYGNVNYSYRDGMFYTSDGFNKTSSYNLLNAKLGIQRTVKHFTFEIYGGATNITGAKYAYMVFLNQLPDAYMPAPNEINYFGGINLKYTF